MTLTFSQNSGLRISTTPGSVGPVYPSPLSAGDVVVMMLAQRAGVANSGTVTTPSGWTLQGVSGWQGGYGATNTADQGNMQWYVYTKDVVDGTESGFVNGSGLTCTNDDVTASYVFSFSTSGGGTISYAFASGGDSSSGSPMSVTCGTDPGITTNDYVIAGLAVPTDVITWSGETISSTSATIGTVTQRNVLASAFGNNIGLTLFTAPVTSGTSSAAPVIAGTVTGTNTNARGPGFVLRIRETLPQTLEYRLGALITPLGADMKKAAVFDVPFQRPGTLAVFTGPRIYFPDNVELVAATFELSTQPTGSSAIFEVLKDGSGSYSSDPTISVSTNLASAGTLSGTTTFTARTNYLQISCSQIGSSVAGSDLTVVLKMRLT